MKRTIPFIIAPAAFVLAVFLGLSMGIPLWANMLTGVCIEVAVFIQMTNAPLRAVLRYQFGTGLTQAFDDVCWTVVTMTLLEASAAFTLYYLAGSLVVPVDQAGFVDDIVSKSGIAFVIFFIAGVAIGCVTGAFGELVRAVVRAGLTGALVLCFGVAVLPCLLDLLERDPRSLLTIAVLCTGPLLALLVLFAGRIGAPRIVMKGSMRHEALGSVASPVYAQSIADLMVYDDERVAVHEAGHVLTHAVLGALHPSLFARIDGIVGRHPSGGVVSSKAHVQLFYAIEGARWSMHNLLAGVAAERCVFGDSPMGSASENWMSRICCRCCDAWYLSTASLAPSRKPGHRRS